MSKYLICVVLFALASCHEKKTAGNESAPSAAVVEQPLGEIEGGLPTGQKSNNTVIKKVTVQEAKALSKEGYSFMDLRTKEEIQRGKIEGAMELSVKAFDFITTVDKMSRDTKIILYCSAGNRSELASKLFSQLEFTNVVNMSGGYSAWSETEE